MSLNRQKILARNVEILESETHRISKEMTRGAEVAIAERSTAIGVEDDGGWEASREDSDAGINAAQNCTIKQIENAKQAIRDNVYGICETCGKNIPTVRLKEYPYATNCKPCQEEEEVRANEWR